MNVYLETNERAFLLFKKNFIIKNFARACARVRAREYNAIISRENGVIRSDEFNSGGRISPPCT